MSLINLISLRLYGVTPAPSPSSPQIAHKDLGLSLVTLDANTFKIIVSLIFVFMGFWATLWLLVGGFRFIISNGNPGDVQKARNTILYAAIGLGISVLAFTIVQFVLGAVS